ncbi:MAG: hypothetical protein KDB68_17525, partial [Planctomycetes bacterium]|nr:hypothetical protein [Planctomycetota bacterium]
FAFDELGMTGSTGWVDHGPQASQTQIDVTAAGAAHDLGAGNSAGAVTILTAADEIGWGKPAGSATVAATIHGDSSKATVFGYDTSDTMSSGTAPARRVGMWMYRVSDNLINTAGWEFFDAAVNWAANITGGSTGSTNITWSYPNLQGSIAVQADNTGTQTSGTHVYTPDGVPTAGGLPDTRPGEMDDTWLGAHARPLEHATGLQPVIEMGARQYHPVLARFLEVDPIEGGLQNDYGYVTDPSNQVDTRGAAGHLACQAGFTLSPQYGTVNGQFGRLCIKWKDRWRITNHFTVSNSIGVRFGLATNKPVRVTVHDLTYLPGRFSLGAGRSGNCAWLSVGVGSHSCRLHATFTSFIDVSILWSYAATAHCGIWCRAVLPTFGVTIAVLEQVPVAVTLATCLPGPSRVSVNSCTVK